MEKYILIETLDPDQPGQYLLSIPVRIDIDDADINTFCQDHVQRDSKHIKYVTQRGTIIHLSLDDKDLKEIYEILLLKYFNEKKICRTIIKYITR